MGGVFQLRQPNIRLTGFLQELPHTLHAAPSRAKKSGHHGCTPKQIRIADLFLFKFFKFQEWLKCPAELKICWKFLSIRRAQSQP